MQWQKFETDESGCNDYGRMNDKHKTSAHAMAGRNSMQHAV